MGQSAPKLTHLEYDIIASAYLGGDKVHAKRQIKILWIWVPAGRMNEFYELLKEINSKSFPGSRSSVSSTPGPSNKDRRQNSLGSINSAEASTKKSHISTVLERAEWKTLTLETNSDDAWQIVDKVNLEFP